MNNPLTKSSIVNTSGANLALILWIATILSAFTPASFIMAIICIAILLFERQSDYLRNHVSQVLALTLIYTLLDIVFYLLFGGRGFALFALFRFIGNVLASLIQIALTVLKIAFCLIGLMKAFEKKDVQVPFIAEFGNSLERSITPESI